MSDVIILWSGSIASIPSGSFLCDGNNGTPDLRNYFIVAKDGTADFLNLGQTGGASTKSYAGHYHSIASHYHSTPSHGTAGYYPSTFLASSSGAMQVSHYTHTHTTSASNTGNGSGYTYGGTAQAPYNGLENRPLYYALAYVTVNADLMPAGAVALLNSDSIPGGWLLCNGTGGAPDLRGKFVRCKNAIGDSASTGGVKTVGVPAHTHSANHYHGISGYSGVAIPTGTYYANGGNQLYPSRSEHQHNISFTTGYWYGNTGNETSAAVSNLPIYKVLNWVVKS